ncbi:restriction endonuclease subunit S [Pseudomonas jessenii]|nr:restriction endonuclease subunit S [Pseudomonas jessenii]
MTSKTKTPEAKEACNPALVPKLRFPGFDKPWSYDPLSKTLKEHKIKNTAGRDVFSVSMEYGIVNQIELLGRSFAAANTSHYTIGRQFDVVYTKSPLKAFPFGIVKQCKFDGEVALSPLYGVFTPPNPHLGLMIEAYFESPSRSKDFLSPLCQKGAKNTLQITNTTFLTGRLPLPTQPAEQQRIAECLSSVDDLITAQSRKVDALKAHKKGLIQQLFPCEGETQPRLRFPEFQGAEEWDEVDFSDVIFFQEGPGIMAVDFRDEGVPLVRLSGLAGQSVSLIGCNYLEPDKVEEKWSHFRLEAGDIVVSCSASFGRPAIVTDAAVGAVFYTGLIRFRAKDRRLDVGYLEVFLGSPCFLRQAESAAVGGGIKHFGPTHLRQMKVPLPRPDEQQRIANCLSYLDDLISAQVQKHEALKVHKKGLMQQLFPSPAEVEL